MKESNLQQIKINTWLLANAIGIYDVGYGIVQHPFTSNIFYKNIILNTQENINLFLNDIKEFLNECSDTDQIFYRLNKPWLLTWIKLNKQVLSVDDLSKYLAYAWVCSEDPNNDVNVKLRTVISWFKNANKNILMDKDEATVYNNIPNKIELFRGVSYNRNTNGLSYTASLEKAEWFMNRWNKPKALIRLEVDKKDILAYFNGRNEDEYVVDTIKYKEEIKKQL